MLASLHSHPQVAVRPSGLAYYYITARKMAPQSPFQDPRPVSKKNFLSILISNSFLDNFSPVGMDLVPKIRRRELCDGQTIYARVHYELFSHEIRIDC